MANKSGIAIGLIAIVAIASGVGYYFLVYQPSQVPRLTLVNGSESKSYTLDDILSYIDKKNITLINMTATFDGVLINVEGFNPLDLYMLNGWNYVDEVQYESNNGSKQIINASRFLLGDTKYVSTALGDTSMIVFKVNGTLLKDYNSKYGDFALIGQTLSTDQKLFAVTKLTYVSDWKVAVKVNGVIKSYISTKNISSFTNGNYTNYTYSYTDYSSGKSWNNSLNQGVTIASLTTIASITTEYYAVSFSTVDGFSTKYNYNKTLVENGVTGKFITDATNASVELSHEGKQMMLSDKCDNKALSFADGPFRTIVPGQTRDKYLKWISEIRFTF